MSDVTRILNAIERGDAQATEELLPLVYEELRLLAAQKLSHEPPGQTLQATALVHEAYIRLVEAECRSWENRGHFFAAAAEAMRRILVENARRKRSEKHGGALNRIDLKEVMLGTERSASVEDVLGLDEAISKLLEIDPVKGELVKLRFFAGLTNEQAARVLGVSTNTADRYWAYARAWIRLRIQGSDTSDDR
jgi:RNA polymerase sigma factor (TIGR02999 family)